MVRLQLLALGALASLAVGKLLPNRHNHFKSVLKHRSTDLLRFAPAVKPSNYLPVLDLLNPLAPYEYTLHLRSADMDGLYRKMYEIRDKGQRWLKDDQLKQYLAPTSADRQAVTDWLHANGEDKYKFGKFEDHVVVQSTVAKIQDLFACQLTQFTSPLNRTVFRTDQYQVRLAIKTKRMTADLSHSDSYRSHRHRLARQPIDFVHPLSQQSQVP